jgi:hypothetical protein
MKGQMSFASLLAATLFLPTGTDAGSRAAYVGKE